MPASRSEDAALRSGPASPAAPPARPARSSRPRPALVAALVLLVVTAGVFAALRPHRSAPSPRPAPDPPVVQLRLWIDGQPVRVGGTTTVLRGRRYAIVVQASSAPDVQVSDFSLLLNGPRSGSVGGRPSGNFVSLAYQAQPGNPHRVSASWIAASVGGSTTVTLAVLYSVAQGQLSASVGPSLQTIIVR